MPNSDQPIATPYAQRAADFRRKTLPLIVWATAAIACVFLLYGKTRQFEYIGIAFVILNDGAKADEEEIARYLKEHLASFKVPAHIFFTDEFPMTAGTEKVQKFKLREIALQKLAEDPAEPV